MLLILNALKSFYDLSHKNQFFVSSFVLNMITMNFVTT